MVSKWRDVLVDYPNSVDCAITAGINILYNNNNNGSTSESSNTQSGREHVRISNVLISQKISMNVNLLNGDCWSRKINLG